MKRFSSLKVDFQSLKVMERVQVWVAAREIGEREDLARRLYTEAGWASPFGHMFQSQYLDRWAKQRLVELDVNQMVKKNPGRPISNLVCGGEMKKVNIRWDRKQPLFMSVIPNLDFDIFYYEATPVTNLPVADAIILHGQECTIFQMTRKKVHSISDDGYRRIVDRLPQDVQVINYILVCPEDGNTELGHSTWEARQDFTSTKGKALQFFVAKVPLIYPTSTEVDEADDADEADEAVNKITTDEDEEMTG